MIGIRELSEERREPPFARVRSATNEEMLAAEDPDPRDAFDTELRFPAARKRFRTRSRGTDGNANRVRGGG